MDGGDRTPTADVAQIFGEALGLGAERRATYLERACAGNPAAREQVERMLNAVERRVEGGSAFLGHDVPAPANAAASDASMTGLGISEPNPAQSEIETRAERPPGRLGGNDGYVPPEHPGAVVGKYRILKLLGEGAFGSVFMAEPAPGGGGGGAPVALKVIKPGMDTRQVIARFAAERQALSLMDHPNIAKVYDAGATENGRPYFVMELVAGVPLNVYCDCKRLNVRARVELLVTVCRAVQHAHQKGVIHRDLKSNNILVADAGGQPVVKVIDFGIAKATDGAPLGGETIYTATNRMIGTPMYMSPEQARGEVDIDTRTDVYSLGAILYELLTGTTPLDAQAVRGQPYDRVARLVRKLELEAPAERVRKLADRQRGVAAARGVEPARLMRQLRGDLEWVVTKCLRKDRDRRYESVSALAADLARYLNREPVLTGPAGSWYHLKKFATRHRLAAALIAIAVAATALGFGLAAYGLLRATRLAEAADRTAQREIAQRRTIEKRLSDEMLAQATAIGLAGPWEESKALFADARSVLIGLGEPTLPADVGLWEAYRNAPEALTTFAGHAAAVNSIAVSADGRHAVSGSADTTLRLWDLPTGRAVRTLRGHTGPVLGVAMSPDGNLAVSGSADGTLRLWDLPTGRTVRTFHGHGGQVMCVAFAPDGLSILSGGNDNTMRLWDAQTGRERRSFAGHGGWVSCVAVAPDGRTALSGGNDATVTHWDLSTGQELRSLVGHAGTINGVAFTRDGAGALSCGDDRTLKLWNLSTGEEVRTLAGHGDVVDAVAVSPDGRTALSAGHDRKLKLWNLGTGEEIRTLARAGGAVTCVAFAPDGRTALAGGADRAVRVWDLGPDREVLTIGGQSGAVYGVAPAGDGRTALSAGDDDVPRLWDLATGRELIGLRGHRGQVMGVALSDDGRIALSAGADRTLRVWELPGGKLFKTLTGHAGVVDCAAISPDGRTALSGGHDRSVRLWDLATGKVLHVLHGHADWVRSVAFAPDGLTALSGSHDDTVRQWDLHSGREIAAFRGHDGWVTSVAFAPDGATMFSGSLDNTVKRWNLQTGRELRTFAGHEGAVRSVAVSRDGRTLASASEDMTVRLWDVATGREVRALRGHLRAVTSVAFRPADGALVSGGEDGSVKLWAFSRAQGYRDFAPRLAAAREALLRAPDDAAALAVLGGWYEFRGLPARALPPLEAARAAGAAVPPMQLARCDWQSCDEEDPGPVVGALMPPVRWAWRQRQHALLAAAEREYTAALAAASDPRERLYLQLCLDAVRSQASRVYP